MARPFALRAKNGFVNCLGTIGLCLLALLGAELAWATKAQGPFSVAARIEGNHATITVRTFDAAQEVELQLSGTDGLEVQGAAQLGSVKVKTLRRAALAPADTWTVETDFTPGAGLCYLSALVSAKGLQPVERAFSVGELSEAQKAERRRGARIDPDGVPVKLLNPDEPKAELVAPHAQSSPGVVGFPIHASVQVDEAAHSAKVTVTATKSGSNVTVKAYGLDGLVVDDSRPEGALLINTHTREKLVPGETMSFEVQFRPGPGKSLLVVEAKGDGIGTALVNCPVGQETEEQRRSRNQGVTTDPEGNAIRLMGK